MELFQLEYFRVVAQCQSITRAAEQLHLSQPSLSIAISRLERDLGVQLFDRVGGRIRLNHTGQLFQRRVDRILTELNETRLELSDQEAGSQMPIHVGASDVGLCSELLTDYMQAHPQQRVRFFDQPPEQLHRQLESGELDFAVSTSPLCAPELVWENLLEERLVVLMAPSCPLAGRASVTLPELEGERFVVQCSGMQPGGEYQHLFDGQSYTPDAVFTTNELEVAFRMAELGIGVCICSFFTARRMLKNPNHSLRAVPLHTRQTARTVGIARWKGHYLTGSARQFYDCATAFFRRLQQEQQDFY